jgi:hypothetical protein
MPVEYSATVNSLVGLIGLMAKALRRKMGKKKYRAFIANATTELLKEHPDLNRAQANMALAEALDIEPNAELYQVQQMFRAVRASSSCEKKDTYYACKKAKAKARMARSPRKRKAKAKKESK